MRSVFAQNTLLLLGSIMACGGNDSSAQADGNSDTGGAAGRATAAAGSAGRGQSASGSGGSAGAGSGSGGASSGGTASADTAGAGGTEDSRDGSGTLLTGTLGALGAVQPTVSSLVISNSGETLVYMSSAPITCELLTTSRWLGMVDTGSQVVEIVVPSRTTPGTVQVEEGGAEVNYAPGGMSSAYEKGAASGSVTFTTYTPNGPVDGSVSATYTNPTGSVSGTFHAEFCTGGQGY